jgi:succinate dehydrogenase / fumarate reductase cytochrome b subunit
MLPTMLLSGLHRITGAALTLGLVLFVYWLLAHSLGRDSYAQAQAFYAHWWVRLAVVGWIFSFCYHLLNGIRHAVWDAGYGFDFKVAVKSGAFTFGAALLLTVLVCVLLMVRSGGVL